MRALNVLQVTIFVTAYISQVAALAGEPTNSLCSAAEEISKQQNEALSSLRTCVQRLNAELFECPEGLEPAMTPPSLGEVMRGVESANTALMEGVNEIASSYAAKTEQVRAWASFMGTV